MTDDEKTPRPDPDRDDVQDVTEVEDDPAHEPDEDELEDIKGG